MAVTLNTDLQPLMFSSQVPDISITVSDDNEAEVMIDTQERKEREQVIRSLTRWASNRPPQ